MGTQMLGRSPLTYLHMQDHTVWIVAEHTLSPTTLGARFHQRTLLASLGFLDENLKKRIGKVLFKYTTLVPERLLRNLFSFH